MRSEVGGKKNKFTYHHVESDLSTDRAELHHETKRSILICCAFFLGLGVQVGVDLITVGMVGMWMQPLPTLPGLGMLLQRPRTCRTD